MQKVTLKYEFKGKNVQFSSSERRNRKMNFKNLFQNGTNAHKLQVKRSLEMD